MPMKCKNKLKFIMAFEKSLGGQLHQCYLGRTNGWRICPKITACTNVLASNNVEVLWYCTKRACFIQFNKAKNSCREQRHRGGTKSTRVVGMERIKKKNEDRRRIISNEYPSKIKAAQICKPNQTKNEKLKLNRIRYLLHELAEIIIYQHRERTKTLNHPKEWDRKRRCS